MKRDSILAMNLFLSPFKVILSVLFFTMQACSSGGSDSGGAASSQRSVVGQQSSLSSSSLATSNPSAPLSIDFEQQVLSWSLDDSLWLLSSPPTADVIGTFSGQIPEELFIYVSPSEEIFSSVTHTVSGNLLRLRVAPIEGLWPGLYEGQFLLSVCADEQCNVHLDQSPYLVPYSINYQPAGLLFELNGERVELGFDSRVRLTIDNTLGDEQFNAQIEQYIPSSVSGFVLPEDMVSELNVTDISDESFVVSLPVDEVGTRVFEYEIPYVEQEVEKSLTFQLIQNITPAEFDEQTPSLLSTSGTITIAQGTGAEASPVQLATVFVPSGLTGTSSLSVSYDMLDCLWLEVERFVSLDRVGFIDIPMQVDATTLMPGQYSCAIEFTAGSVSTGIFTLEATVTSGFASGAAYSFSQFTSDIAPGELQIFADPSSVPSGVAWEIISSPEWLIIDPQWMVGAHQSASIGVTIDWQTIYDPARPAGDYALTDKLVVRDTNNLLPEAEMAIWVHYDVFKLESITPQVVQTGEPFTLTLIHDGLEVFEGLSEFAVLNEFAVSKVGQTQGLEGLTSISTSYRYIDANTVEIDFEGVGEAGAYQLIVLTPTEKESDLGAFFAAPLEFEVREQAVPQNPLNLQIRLSDNLN